MFKSFAPHMTDSYKLGHIYQYPAGPNAGGNGPSGVAAKVRVD